MTKKRVLISIMLLFSIFTVFSCSDSGKDDGKPEIESGDSANSIQDNNSDEDISLEENEDRIGSESDDESGHDPIGEEKPLTFESNFIEIESTDYIINYGGSTLELETSPARFWYSFQPAEDNPEDKPIFVFFNGGPGASTMLLLGFNTGKNTIDPAVAGEDIFVENPFSWRTLGNLLYIDARQTGFSYDMSDDLSYEYFRDEYSQRNFNPMIDAADFIKVILRFMDRHPTLKDNEVILTGESYGGTRAIAILNQLIYYSKYDEESLFYDEELSDEIDSHFREIFPSQEGEIVSPEVISKQFGKQILIQPLIFGIHQSTIEGELLEKEDSPLYEVAEEEGAEFIPCEEEDKASGKCQPHRNALAFIESCNRDGYFYTEKANWMMERVQSLFENFLTSGDFEEFLEVDGDDMTFMFSSERENSYRSIGNDYFMELPEFSERFGELGEFDSYFTDLNMDAFMAFSRSTINHYIPEYGEMFTKNLPYVNTFITQAARDLVVYAPAIPESIKMGSLIQKVEREKESFTVFFKDGAFSDENLPGKVEIAFPRYDKSGHSVSMHQPEEFLEDVAEWLSISQ